MNFQKIPPVETSKDILDIAFRKARERGKQKNLKGNWLEIIRKKESLKLDIVKESITSRLQKIYEIFPKFDELPPFYTSLFKLTQDDKLYLESLYSVKWAIKQVSDLHKDHVRRVVKVKTRDDAKEILTQFYGRASSVLKQISKRLKVLEEARKIMRTYPDIKELFTVCIYGFPNVGKTTLLNQLTGTKAETAAYAFTTKSINAGYMTINKEKVQVLDVPGTLARDNKMNDIERQAELVLSDLADVIIYVFDVSGTSGYSLVIQEELFKKVKERKDVIIYLSKKDIISEEKILSFKYPHRTLREIKKEIGEHLKNKQI
ncbi:MAG: GTPase [archaeon]|nr:GTPase [archaeon]